jgi:hypothetical protein
LQIDKIDKIDMFELNNYFMDLAIPAGIVAAVAILWIIATALLRHSARRNSRGAVPQEYTGSSRERDCLIQLKADNDYLKYVSIGMWILPVGICGAYLAVRYFGVARGGWVEITGLAIFALVLMLFVGSRRLRMIGARNEMSLVYDSRVATRRVLDPLLKEDHYVFHDVVGEQFCIDHLVVGPKGVFAIQTHAEPVTSLEQGLNVPIVTYNGRELLFPKGSDHGIAERARLNAQKLSHWINGQAEEQIAVRAIVSLPGWTVRRTSSEGIPIINPKQFASLFEYIQPWELPASSIETIGRRIQQISSDSSSTSAVSR